MPRQRRGEDGIWRDVETDEEREVRTQPELRCCNCGASLGRAVAQTPGADRDPPMYGAMRNLVCRNPQCIFGVQRLNWLLVHNQLLLGTAPPQREYLV